MFKRINTASMIIKYKGKEYNIWKVKREQKVRPVGEENDARQEITVKDFKVGGWNVTVNVNNETIVVGWGPGKHFSVWGSIFFLLVFIIYTIRHRLIERDKARWKKIVREVKKHDS